MKQIILFLGIGSVLTGCTTARVATDITWTDNERVYLSYWEGSCKPLLGCDRGSSHVKMCSVKPDNSMLCQEQKDIDKVLNN